MRKKICSLFTILLLTFACVCAFAFTACATDKADLDDEPSQTVTYTVTFKQDGYDDIVKTVEEGGNLTDIPLPVPKAGYTIVWEEKSYTNITGNFIVNAIETANNYTVTYKLGVNTYAALDSYAAQATYGETFTLKTPEYSGSAPFLGWYLADADGKATDEKAENGKCLWTEDVTLIAKWGEWSPVVS